MKPAHTPMGLLRDAETAIQRGDLPAAMQRYRVFLSQYRTHPKALQVRARAVLVCTQMGEFDRAVELGELAGAAADREVRLLYAIAQAQFYAARPVEAEAALRRCLAADPDHAASIGRMVVILQNYGRRDEAVALIDQARGRGVDAWELDHAFAQLAPGFGRTDEAIDRLRARIDEPNLPVSGQREVAMSLAGLLEKRGEFAEAWRMAGRANAVGGARWNPDGDRARIDRTIEACSAGTFDAMADAVAAVDRADGLVFVAGMPRSGTTLIDQILAAHPGCESVGESRCLERAGAGVRLDGTDGGKMARLSVKKRNDAGRALVESMRAACGACEGTAVVDKQPFNDVRLGLLAAIAPGAKVVLTRRDPRDIALSCYFRNFAGGMAWTKRMEWITAVIRERMRLHAHWLEVLPAHAPWVSILEGRYETIVSEPESEARRLVAHAGLAWNAACLRFGENKRMLTTLDASQAGKGVYTGSVARWKRYEPHAGGGLDGLHEIAEALGYEGA